VKKTGHPGDWVGKESEIEGTIFFDKRGGKKHQKEEKGKAIVPSGKKREARPSQSFKSNREEGGKKRLLFNLGGGGGERERGGPRLRWEKEERLAFGGGASREVPLRRGRKTIIPQRRKTALIPSIKGKRH